jgi:steroid 5-alpha reductase family enzyme
MAVGAYWLLSPGGPALQSGRPWIVLGLICLWGLRLTFNWARGWSGLSHEDWRYVDIRAVSKKLYWPASFMGIHFMPTTIVFFGLVAVYPALRAHANPLGLIDLAACLVTLAAIGIEATADQQLREFVLARPAAGSLMEDGLWRYSRHPNYFGEICFWWGLFLFGLAADPSWWWAIAAPISMTCLFLFISLPLIEARMKKRRPGYPERVRTTSLLLPWPPKKSWTGFSPTSSKSRRPN